MASGLDTGPASPDEPPKTASQPSSARRNVVFVVLAGILAIIGISAAGYHLAMRPVILRIAVGPANSDDLKVVQALSQAFAQTHSQIRLRPIQTEGATTSAQIIADGNAELAVVRGDLNVPKNVQAVAPLPGRFSAH